MFITITTLDKMLNIPYALFDRKQWIVHHFDKQLLNDRSALSGTVHTYSRYTYIHIYIYNLIHLVD